MTAAPLLAQWVIVGAVAEEGVLVMASDEMAEAELRLIQDETMRLGLFAGGLREMPEPRIAFTAKMGRYVMVFGPDYAEALRRLFASWSPTEQQQSLALPPPTPPSLKA